MSTIVVRYQTQPEHSDANQQLVEDVFAELAATNPAGLRYATYRLGDGTFVHIADVDGPTNPLNAAAAFARFLDGIQNRCEPGHGPNSQPATLVGSYAFPTG